MDKMLTRKQYDKWLKKLPDGYCTFCEWEKNQIVLKEFEHWVWIANLAPYWRYHTMIIPKRHFIKYSDMTFKEAGELTIAIDYGEKKMLDANLTDDKGNLYKRIVYFWRFRMDNKDPISGSIRPDHWHLHLSPDRDHSWDSTLDGKAYSLDITVLK